MMATFKTFAVVLTILLVFSCAQVAECKKLKKGRGGGKGGDSNSVGASLWYIARRGIDAFAVGDIGQACTTVVEGIQHVAARKAAHQACSYAGFCESES